MKFFRHGLFVWGVLLSVQPQLAHADLSDAVSAYNTKKYNVAFSEFTRLSEQGNAIAQYNLGVMYAKGHGVARDPVQAVKWFRQAAHKGNSNAQYNLGVMYAQGEGVAQDFVRALMWLNIAETDETKHPLDKMTLFTAQATVRKLMTRNQIAEADKLAREWQPGKN